VILFRPFGLLSLIPKLLKYFGFPIFDFELTWWWLPDDDYLMMVTWWWLSDDGYLMMATWWWLPDHDYLMMVTWWWLPDDGYLMMIIWWWLPDDGYLMMVTWWWLPDDNYLMMVTWWWLFQKCVMCTKFDIYFFSFIKNVNYRCIKHQVLFNLKLHLAIFF
jgi:hypothetical protein